MSEIIDLSVDLDSKTLSAPSQGEKLEVSHVYREPGWWQASSICLSVHTGTHVDSPLHTLPDKEKVGEISLDRVVGIAVRLDLTHVDPNYEITDRDLKKLNVEMNENMIIILHTGWTSQKWKTEEYFNESPYLSLDGAKWLSSKNPKAICFDFFEEYTGRLPDFKPDDFEIHRELLGNNIIIVEHLINLDQLPVKDFQICAAPIKLVETEAAPARVFAIV